MPYRTKKSQRGPRPSRRKTQNSQWEFWICLNSLRLSLVLYLRRHVLLIIRHILHLLASHWQVRPTGRTILRTQIWTMTCRWSSPQLDPHPLVCVVRRPNLSHKQFCTNPNCLVPYQLESDSLAQAGAARDAILVSYKAAPGYC